VRNYKGDGSRYYLRARIYPYPAAATIDASRQVTGRRPEDRVVTGVAAGSVVTVTCGLITGSGDEGIQGVTTERLLPGTVIPAVSSSAACRIVTFVSALAGTVPSKITVTDTSLVVGYERRYPLTNALVPDADCCAAGMPLTMT